MFRRRLLRVVVPFILLLLVSAAAHAEPRALSDSEAQRIRDAIQHLKDMGDEAMARNVEEWLKAGKIKAEDGLTRSATTDRKGTIVIDADLLTIPPNATDPLEKFKRDAWLARLLYHEKVHTRQAPEGGKVDAEENRTKEDWDASTDAFAQCKGPEATEVEAYYRFILALLRWNKVIQERKIDEVLEPERRAAEQKLKEEKIKWLNAQVEFWLKRLKETLKYEKAEGGKFLYDRVADLEKRLKEQGNISEHDIKLKKMDLLESALDDLFEEGGAYNRVREIYKEKRGNKKTEVEVGPEGGVLPFPDEAGMIVYPGMEAAAGPVRLAVYEFQEPPGPPPGYIFLSPVYDIELTGWPGPLPKLSISFFGIEVSPEAKIYYFAPYKGEQVPSWAPLETVKSTEHSITATTEFATMHVVMAPILGKPLVVEPLPITAEPVKTTVTMFIGSTRFLSAEVEDHMDVAPFIKDDRTFVPVRFLAESFGAVPDWTPKDAPVEEVTLTRPDMQITIWIGSPWIRVEREDGAVIYIQSDVAAFIQDGRTVLPFRVIAEAFGAEVDYGPKDAPVEWVRFRK